MALNPIKNSIETSFTTATRKVEQAASSSTASGLKKDTFSISQNATICKPVKDAWAKIKNFFTQIGDWLKGLFSSGKNKKNIKPTVETTPKTPPSSSGASVSVAEKGKVQPASPVIHGTTRVNSASASKRASGKQSKPDPIQPDPGTSGKVPAKARKQKTGQIPLKTGPTLSSGLPAVPMAEIKARIKPLLDNYNIWLNKAKKKVNTAYREQEFQELQNEHHANVKALKDYCNELKQQYGNKIRTSKYFKEAKQHLEDVAEKPNLNTLAGMVKQRQAVITEELAELDHKMSGVCQEIKKDIEGKLESAKKRSNPGQRREELLALKEKVSKQLETLKREVKASKAAQARKNNRDTLSDKTILKKMDSRMRILAKEIEHEIDKLPADYTRSTKRAKKERVIHVKGKDGRAKRSTHDNRVN